jgi:myo-inositol-1(or 4)-monophosphatase
MLVRLPELDVMIRAARAAGEGLKRDFARIEQLKVVEKNPSDFVSSADLCSQATLRAELSAAFPHHDLLLEEGDSSGSHPARSCFLVDPLDGTTNFLHGIPHFAIAIALEAAGQVIAGVVLDPVKDELFWAQQGGGAWLGERRLSVSAESDLSRSVIGTGIPHRGSALHSRYLSALAGIMPRVAGIRRFGSAALDLAYVAAGRFEVFFEGGLAPWDVAAGTLMVREAGGIVTKSNGSVMTLDGADVLAANSAVVHAGAVGLLEPLHRAISASA